MEPWYENPQNVLDLARWMCDQSDDMGEPKHESHLIVDIVYKPQLKLAEQYWQVYQASLKLKEPTLSEQLLRSGIPETSTFMLLAKRIEALERKVG